jgi:hypothetical protein
MNLKSQILKFWICSVCTVFSVVLIFGCASTTPEAPLTPDRARLVVTLKAEPKKGWHSPRDQSEYAGTAQVGQGKQFETVDYSALDEIVVWVEPAAVEASQVTDITIDLGAAKPSLRVVPIGAVWFVKGGSAYLRSEDGRVMNLASSSRPNIRGYVEVMVETKPEPVARLYVTPTRFAQVGESNKKLTIDDLPPGPAKIVCWHPRLPGSQANIDLQAGQSTSATLTVGVNTLPKIP